MSNRRPVVAIDGPSGAGKSTAGRALAERLGFSFVDSGAMYRAIGLAALRAAIALDDGAALAQLAGSTSIRLVGSRPRVFLDGDEITDEIRTQEVSAAASRASAHSGVRRALVAQQQALGRDGGIVMDGRDIGSAVFPNAEVKFFLDAAPARRAERRCRELGGNATTAEVERIEREIHERDLADSTRSDSPLVRLPDAIYLDSSTMTPEEVVESMVAAVEMKCGLKPNEKGA
jgi:cytidylate kinase